MILITKLTTIFSHSSMMNSSEGTTLQYLMPTMTTLGRTLRAVLALTVLAACMTLAGCAKKTLDTSYYLIEFASNATNPKLIRAEPLPYRVQVLNFKIPRSYDSIRMIARFSSHQINYFRYSLWAVRPQIAVADLVVQQVNAYRLFKDCQREFLDERSNFERPDFEITGEVSQIERFESEKFSAAHLRMDFDLYDYNNKDIILTHNFDREVQIPGGNMTIFAKAISDIVAEESENFLIKVVDHFSAAAADTLTGAGAQAR